MTSILLVDDDALFRSSFAGLVDWRSIGFHLLQAENGQAAIKALDNDKSISCIFTDMDMPLLDGVELIEYVSKEKPQIKIIGLSAYDDFHYVKNSMQKGAVDYLLKHTITSEKIVDLLHQITNVQDRPKKTDALQKDMRDQFLSDLLAGKYALDSDLQPIFNALQLPEFEKDLIVMVFVEEQKSGGTASSRSDIIRTMQDMIQNVVDRIGTGTVFRNPSDGHFYMLITSDAFHDLQYSEQCARICATQIESLMNRYFNIHGQVYASSVCRWLGDINLAYRQILMSAGLVVVEHKAEGPLTKNLVDANAAQLLEIEIRYGGPSRIRKAVVGYFQQARALRYTRANFVQMTASMLGIYETIIAELQREGVPVDSRTTTDAQSQLLQSDVVQQEHCVQQFCELSEQIRQHRASLYSPMICRALETIFAQYGDSHLSLNYISGELNTNASYLSRIFKQELGSNISTYIVGHRLMHAKALLSCTELSIKAILTQCGFENYNYFFRVFKQYIGMTPKEFRDTLQQKKL